MSPTTHSALSLFDYDEDGSSNVVALGSGAAAARKKTNRHSSPTNGSADAAGEDAMLGTLVWFSVSDAVRLTPETLRAAISGAGLKSATLMPGAPGEASALSRASEAAQVRGAHLTHDRSAVAMDGDMYANVLFRTAARGVKQMVTEILDAANTRLSYQPLAAVRPSENKDGTLRNSGGMYFIPRQHESAAHKLLSFVDEVRGRAEDAPGKKAKPSRAMSVPLVDREEYREVVSESLEEHVEKEAKAAHQGDEHSAKGRSGSDPEAGQAVRRARRQAQGRRGRLRGAAGDARHRGPHPPGDGHEAGQRASQPRREPGGLRRPRLMSEQRPLPAPASGIVPGSAHACTQPFREPRHGAGEYLGTDGAGRDHYTRGGRVYAVRSKYAEGCDRGRLARFNRLGARRHSTGGAIAA